jgi:NitT/TauT family transport system ATP-binding protein
MIAFDAVHKSLGGKPILDGVTFEVPAGHAVTLFGPNGCGKSTLMLLLSGLIKPDSGHIVGAEALKGKIGFVFQDYRRHLMPWLNGYDNIIFPLRLKGIDSAVCKQRVDALVEEIGCTVDLSQRVFTLSGGQAQMVSLLRALIINPDLLILDEPFSAIDYGWTLTLRQKIMSFCSKKGLSILFISHDLEEALYMGNRVVFLTPRPAKVFRELDVPLAWPREPDLMGQADFAQLKLQALKLFLEIQAQENAPKNHSLEPDSPLLSR